MSLFKKEGAESATTTVHPAPEPEGLTMGVSTIEYNTVRNALINLEWVRERDDYVYQWEMLKGSALGEKAVLARLIAAADDCFPRETHVHFDKPIAEGELKFPFWTIRVRDIATRPGAEEACEKKFVDVLSRLNVWT